jgi:hypothetical protein
MPVLISALPESPWPSADAVCTATLPVNAPATSEPPDTSTRAPPRLSTFCVLPAEISTLPPLATADLPAAMTMSPAWPPLPEDTTTSPVSPSPVDPEPIAIDPVLTTPDALEAVPMVTAPLLNAPSPDPMATSPP